MPRPAMISARPPEIRSTVAKSSKTRTGIRRAQDGDRARQADALGHRRNRRQYDGRGRDRHIQPMVFADRKNIETRRIGKLRCSKDLR